MRVPPSLARRLLPWGVTFLLCATFAPAAEAEDEGKGAPRAPAPAAAAEPTMKLLEAGAEPRTVLRLKAPQGLREKAGMTVRMTMEGVGLDASPTFTLDLLSEVKEVLPKDERRYEMVLGGLSLDLGAAEVPDKERMDAMFAVMKGTKFAVTVTGRGHQKDLKVTLPEGVDPAVSKAFDGAFEQMRDFGPPFLPEEAVGVGARWEVAGPETSNRFSVDQTVVFTLKARDKDRLTLGMAVAQTGKPQALEDPSLGGVSVELESLTSKGTGELVYDLARMLPVKAAIAVTSSVVMKVGGADAEPMTMNMAIDASFTSEVVPAATPSPPPKDAAPPK